jgi:hypothetical protein
MWQQYRKTLVGMQAVILVVVVGVYLFGGQSLINSAMSFVVMQLGAIFGALWAVRLKARMGEKESHLPLSGRGL